ncbi:thermosome subunit alpha [Natrarchaeobius oligotrophus]|uniref:Thermosome subunit 1 n=1 Tax=Natrarchaeobius chitinivorans TaxID=1679083 RepID=A0A3N6PG96_NATCH|nr:thermosome subunit alpha [Natrarchaeobius chitinivorans]RQG99259.1 thermosome subunit 1 [Natrarchaeobius chitinivorans]
MPGNDVARQPLVSTADADDVRKSNVSAGKQLAETVRTTLGPNGLDKMLVADGMAVVTNDGASILDRLDVSHPVATLVLEVADQQESSAGDGTTSAVVLAGELLDEAETLLERGVHPAKITEGYHLAASRATDHLAERTVSVDFDDDERLRDVARTVVTGKWDESGTEFLADRAVETVRAIERDGRVGFERITRKTIPGGSFYDSEVIHGLVIDMAESSTKVVSPETALPRRYQDATVALVDEALTIDTAQGVGAVDLTCVDDLESLKAYERERYERYAETVTNAGADVLFCQQSIDDPVRYLLAEEGVLAVERTRRDELHKLARTTGAQPVPLDDLSRVATGTATTVERRSVGPTEITVVSGFDEFDQVSVLFRGGTEHVAAETKRMLDNCFYALKLAIEDEAVVPGGGAIEVALARELRADASSLPGKEQLAVEAFADALETVPRILAESSGMNPVDAVLELRTAHHDGRSTAGLNLESGSVDDMVDHGVLEPLHVKRQAIASAAEAANLIVRIDDAVSVSGNGDGHDHDHDHDHGPGGLVHSTDGYPWAVGHSMGHDHH